MQKHITHKTKIEGSGRDSINNKCGCFLFCLLDSFWFKLWLWFQLFSNDFWLDYLLRFVFGRLL